MILIRDFLFSAISVWTWCFFILFIGFWCFISFLWDYIKISSQLQVAQKHVDAFASTKSNKLNVSHLILPLRIIPCLHRSFEFMQTVTVPYNKLESFHINKKDTKIYLTEHIEELFTEDFLFRSCGYLNQAQRFSSYLVTLGIIGTFLGLAFGIGFLATDLTTSHWDDLQTQLQQLLGGASLAFSTSVVGLFGGFFLNLTSNYLLSKLRVSRQNFINSFGFWVQVIQTTQLTSYETNQSMQVDSSQKEQNFSIADFQVVINRMSKEMERSTKNLSDQLTSTVLALCGSVQDLNQVIQNLPSPKKESSQLEKEKKI